jgi:hypothetical protein
MRITHLAFLGVLSLAAGAVGACGGGNQEHQASGTGGSGGGATVASSTTTTTTTTTTSGGVDAGPDADDGMISTTYPAPHSAAPQVVNGGGPVLASPRLVPVFFANEDPTFQAGLTDFVTNIGATPYWTAVTSEYGIGPAVATAPVILTEMAPATTDDGTIQTWLAGKLDGNDPLWPVADDNTIYILHYPSGTGITLSSPMGTEVSCQTFGGYHNSITLDGAHASLDVAYAVVPECQTFDGIKGIDAVTAAESHEIIEGCTDPYPMSNPAWVQTDDNDIYWDLALGGGEVGDMCAQFPGVFTKFAGFDHTVQRTWSNKAATAGKDPCVPELPGEVYFNTAPVLTDSVKFPGIGTMKGVNIAVGASKTIELDLFSEGDTGAPWNVTVEDYAVATYMVQQPTMTFSLDNDSGQNGQKLHLTITVLTKGPYYGEGIFLITSSLGPIHTEWLGLVGE